MAHQITIEGQVYDLALTLGDIKQFQALTGKSMANATDWIMDANAISTIALLAIRPKGKLTAKQIDDGIDESGMGVLMDFVLAKIEAMSAPAISRNKAAQENP